MPIAQGDHITLSANEALLLMACVERQGIEGQIEVVRAQVENSPIFVREVFDGELSRQWVIENDALRRLPCAPAGFVWGSVGRDSEWRGRS